MRRHTITVIALCLTASLSAWVLERPVAAWSSSALLPANRPLEVSADPTDQQCPQVSCNIMTSPSGAVNPGERVTLRGEAKGTGSVSYTWSTTLGALSSTSGKEVILDTTGAASTIGITLTVATDALVDGTPCRGASCSITVPINTPLAHHDYSTAAMLSGGSAPSISAMARAATPSTAYDGSSTTTIISVTSASVEPYYSNPTSSQSNPLRSCISFLASGQDEEAGFGLYSYVLLRRPASDADKRRNLLAVQSLIMRIPPVKAFLRQGVVKPNLNVTYIPLRQGASGEPEPQWVVDNYDYDRSGVLLTLIGLDSGPGPYIISVLRPLAGGQVAPEHCLRQDMSSVPARLDLMTAWISTFTQRAAQKYFWNDDALSHLRLELRTDIAIVAEGSKTVGLQWLSVKKRIASLISWN
jgi:hypothetical protein